MAKTIHNLADVELNGLTVSPPKVLGSGGKMCMLKLDGKPFIFKTPEASMPYGISNWENTKFNIDISIPNTDEFSSFTQKIKEFEGMIIDEACNRSQEFFNKKLSRDVIEAFFVPFIKEAKNPMYPPTMKLKLPFVNGKFTCDAYDQQKQPIEINDENFTKGSKITCILQCSGIWIAGGKFGATFNIVQAKVAPKKSNKIEGYAFVDDSDDDM